MGELPYVLTKHARDRMRQRGIEAEWVAQVLRNPYSRHRDELNPNISKAYGFIYEKGNRVLCVLYEGSTTPWVVVTAYFE